MPYYCARNSGAFVPGASIERIERRRDHANDMLGEAFCAIPPSPMRFCRVRGPAAIGPTRACAGEVAAVPIGSARTFASSASEAD